MRFYIAQVASFLDAAIEACSFIHDSALLCYFDESKKVDRMALNYKHLLLDSGAYSAHTIGAKIDIKKYAHYLQLNGHKFDAYVNLDVIGNAEATLKNQRFLESKGLNPMPAFHRGEDIKYLDDYCGSYEYVGLGGMTEPYQKNRWLTQIFEKYPSHKFHGFGIGAVGLMERYPFYSVDSTGWLVGGIGTVMFANNNNSHYNSLSDEHLLELKEMGFSLDLIKDKYMTRDIFNILTIRRKMANLNKKEITQTIYNNVTEEYA